MSVPSASTISCVYSDHTEDNSTQSSFTFQWNNRAQAVSMTVCLLDAITTASLMPQGNMRTVSLPEQGWLLSTLIRFWRSMCPQSAQHNRKQAPASTVVLLLNSIRSFFTHMTAHQWPSVIPVMTNRIVVLLNEIVTWFLHDVPLPLAASVEEALGLNFIEIATFSGKSVVVRQILLEQLLPSILSAKSSLPRFSSLGSNLQVRYGPCWNISLM